MRGPPITVKCECGQVRHVPYPERWECEQCGRRWNTAQIPEQEYYGILQEMRWFRIRAIAAAVVIFAAFGILAVFVSESLIVLAPILIGGWYILYMPFWRRKVRRRARSLPNWQLRPE